VKIMPDSKNEFTHLSVNDQPRMVDISEKSVTERKAVAVARVHLGSELAALLKDTGSTKKVRFCKQLSLEEYREQSGPQN